MTESKKLRILQQYIDGGLGDNVIINIIDAFDKELPIREKVTISKLYDKINNKENLNEYPNFKEVIKAVEKNKPIYIKAAFRDTFEKFVKTLKTEKKLGSPDDAYNNQIKAD